MKSLVRLIFITILVWLALVLGLHYLAGMKDIKTRKSHIWIYKYFHRIGFKEYLCFINYVKNEKTT